MKKAAPLLDPDASASLLSSLSHLVSHPSASDDNIRFGAKTLGDLLGKSGAAFSPGPLKASFDALLTAAGLASSPPASANILRALARTLPQVKEYARYPRVFARLDAVIPPGLGDDHPKVRLNALVLLGTMGKVLGSPLLQAWELYLPLVFDLVESDPDNGVRAHGMEALLALFEGSKKTLASASRPRANNSRVTHAFTSFATTLGSVLWDAHVRLHRILQPQTPEPVLSPALKSACILLINCDYARLGEEGVLVEMATAAFGLLSLPDTGILALSAIAAVFRTSSRHSAVQDWLGSDSCPLLPWTQSLTDANHDPSGLLEKTLSVLGWAARMYPDQITELYLPSLLAWDWTSSPVPVRKALGRFLSDLGSASPTSADKVLPLVSPIFLLPGLQQDPDAVRSSFISAVTAFVAHTSDSVQETATTLIAQATPPYVSLGPSCMASAGESARLLGTLAMHSRPMPLQEEDKSPLQYLGNLLRLGVAAVGSKPSAKDALGALLVKACWAFNNVAETSPIPSSLVRLLGEPLLALQDIRGKHVAAAIRGLGLLLRNQDADQTSSLDLWGPMEDRVLALLSAHASTPDKILWSAADAGRDALSACTPGRAEEAARTAATDGAPVGATQIILALATVVLESTNFRVLLSALPALVSPRGRGWYGPPQTLVHLLAAVGTRLPGALIVEDERQYRYKEDVEREAVFAAITLLAIAQPTDAPELEATFSSVPELDRAATALASLFPSPAAQVSSSHPLPTPSTPSTPSTPTLFDSPSVCSADPDDHLSLISASSTDGSDLFPHGIMESARSHPLYDAALANYRTLLNP